MPSKKRELQLLTEKGWDNFTAKRPELYRPLVQTTRSVASQVVKAAPTTYRLSRTKRGIFENCLSDRDTKVFIEDSTEKR